MPKIGIIGHFGGNKNFTDGQTIKTKVLYEGLKDAGINDIYRVDTYLNKTNKLKLLFKSVICILKCDIIIILLSSNGIKIYFPMMYMAKIILKKRIYHDVIGGNLDKKIDSNQKYKKYLNSFDENWVEFYGLKNNLEKQGVNNCRVIPNFRSLKIDQKCKFLNIDSSNKFCMFSRVIREKGISDAIIAIDKYNSSNKEKAYLEIWGPIDEKYKEEFEALLEKYKRDVVYKGIANYNDSIKVLSNHIALLFPTYWDGEGFPGTIVDAYVSGLPVIASNWNANSELIDNFKTGWVYPNDKINDLTESIEWAMKNKEDMIIMREECIKKVVEYDEKKHIEIIKKILLKK